MSNLLITGCAGYIGSHTAKKLGRAGHNLTTLDNLSKGFRQAVLHGNLVEGDVGDMDLVDKILVNENIDSVIHFAASTIVPDSVADPLSYYWNNTSKTRNIIECCVRNKVRNFIFS
jgi:UDP-glucose 4-epimerase